MLVAYLSDPSKAQVPPDILAYLSAPRPPPPPAGAPPVRYWTGYGYMNSSEGLPANKPPWSTLTAYDLNKGTIKWQIPLGSVTELAAKGIKDTGSYWPRGGVVVTAGGLIFSGTISDATMRAYEQDTLGAGNASRSRGDSGSLRGQRARVSGVQRQAQPEEIGARRRTGHKRGRGNARVLCLRLA